MREVATLLPNIEQTLFVTDCNSYPMFLVELKLSFNNLIPPPIAALLALMEQPYKSSFVKQLISIAPPLALATLDQNIVEFNVIE